MFWRRGGHGSVCCRVGADLGGQYHSKIFVEVCGSPLTLGNGTGHDGHDVAEVVGGVVSEGVDL